MIEVQNLTKKYGDRYAIKNLNFTIGRGDVVGLLGPNGAGKSTTMKILTGFMSPTSGVARVAGYDVFENPIDVKRRIGYLPETPPLYPEMSVTDYLRYAARLKGVSAKNLVAYVDEALQKTQLVDVRTRVIRNLSKGFRQRVGIAQSIVAKPDVLVLDEPTVGLDPKQVSEMREMINGLRADHTIILSTHILSEVEATCSKIIIIHQGQIVAQDRIENIQHLNQSHKSITIKVRSDEDLLVDFKNVAGVLNVDRLSTGSYSFQLLESENVVDSLLELILRKKAGLIEMTTNHANLEQVFLSLTYNQKNASPKKDAV